MSKLYAIKFIPEDKIIYCGQTIQSGKKRFYDHLRAAASKTKTDAFHTFLREHLSTEFEFIVLEEGDFSKEYLNEKEKYYIGFYDTYNNGFNSYKQSNTINLHPINKRVKWYDNNRVYQRTFNSIVEAELYTGVNVSNISHCCNHIQTKTSKGWFQFEDDNSLLEDSYRLGTSLKVQKLDPFTKELIAEYDSLQVAETTENISPGYLSAVCNGKRYSAKGFLYQYSDESKRVPMKSSKGCRKGVAQVDINTGFVIARFLSINDVVKFLGLEKSKIENTIRKNGKTQGFRWITSDLYMDLIKKGEIFHNENTKIYY